MVERKDKPKLSTRNDVAIDQANLRYIKKNPEEPLPQNVSTLLAILEENEQIVLKKVLDLVQRYNQIDNKKPVGDIESYNLEQERIAVKGEIEKWENRVSDIRGFKKLLHQHPVDASVVASVEAMNSIYSATFNRLGDRNDLREKYIAESEKFDDALDEAQTAYLQELLGHNAPETFLEIFATNLDRYTELSEKILSLEKVERDKALDTLLSTLDFYASLAQPDFEKLVVDEIEKGAQNVIQNQERYFKGFRGTIQRLVEKGADAAINFFAKPEDQNESIARSMLIKSIQLGRDAAKPIQYDKEVIDAVKADTIAQVIRLREGVNVDAVAKLRIATVDLKSNPNKYLNPEDKEFFKIAYSEFLPTTITMMRQFVTVQQELVNDAYRYSHGEKNSDFTADWTLRAKALQSKEGIDYLRTIRLFAPFGIMRPDSVELKDGTDMHLTSPYKTGYFEEHPLMGIAVQDAEFAGTVAVASKLVPALAKISKWLLEKGISKTAVKALLAPPKLVGKSTVWALGKIVGKGIAKDLAGTLEIGPLGTIWGIIETGDELGDYFDDKNEADVMQKILEYRAKGEEIPSKEVETIRQKMLVIEISRNRKWFQSPGVELGEQIDSTFDRWNLGNIGDGKDALKFRESMFESGKLYESYLNANRKLVLLGFEPFEMPTK